MISSNDAEPDEAGSVLKVGQDSAGHWLVQDIDGSFEGRFVSRAAAIAFARSECRSLAGTRVEMALEPLIPTVSFAPAEPWETARQVLVAA